MVVTSAAGQNIGPVFKGQVVKRTDYLTLEGGTDRLSRNVGNHQSTLRNTQGERKSQCYNGNGNVSMIRSGNKKFTYHHRFIASSKMTFNVRTSVTSILMLHTLTDKHQRFSIPTCKMEQ